MLDDQKFDIDNCTVYCSFSLYNYYNSIKSQIDYIYEPSKEELYRLGIMDNKGFLFHKGKGCSVCNGTGYLGRTAIHEIVVVDDLLKDLIDMNAPVIKLREAALHSGFKSIRYSAIRSVLSGVTSSSEIFRVLG